MMLIGGGQERGLRAGTECVPQIVALGQASAMVEQELSQLIIHYVTLKHAFIKVPHITSCTTIPFPSFAENICAIHSAYMQPSRQMARMDGQR